MRHALWAAVAAVGLTAGMAAADGPFVNKPIDTSKYLIQPTREATGFLAGATTTLSRMVGGVIEENGYVRTINNLFGEKPQAPAMQPSGLPAPSLYPSTGYQNSFVPRMPTYQQYGR